MTTPPVRIERRVGQRFPYLLPLSLAPAREPQSKASVSPRISSSRGVFFFTRRSARRRRRNRDSPSACPLKSPWEKACRCAAGATFCASSSPPRFRSSRLSNASPKAQDRGRRPPRRLRISSRIRRGLLQFRPRLVASLLANLTPPTTRATTDPSRFRRSPHFGLVRRRTRARATPTPSPAVAILHARAKLPFQLPVPGIQ